MASLLFPKGKALKAGQRLKRPDLGRTLDLIAAGGADAFYTGPVAQNMVKAVLEASRTWTFCLPPFFFFLSFPLVQHPC